MNFIVEFSKIEPLCIVDEKLTKPESDEEREFFCYPLVHITKLKHLIKGKCIIAIIATRAYNNSFERERIFTNFTKIKQN
ncbi:MAG: hypothetical protein FWF79_05950 [Defluviitaleaceae bacterium]|nr:hypothetical protein [Defluviitaleaceae bacterium]